MIIRQLQLKNYRNYEELTIQFHEKINIFLGENAQGKTNLLESLYVLAMTKSHRTNQEKELIKWEEENAVIQGDIEKRNAKFPIEIFFTPKGRKTKVNYLDQKRLSEYIGQMNVILFAPEDLSLIKGNPSVRRKFLDMELSQIYPVYLHDLVVYQKGLKQKNRYMKQIAIEKKKIDETYMDVLDEQLASSGSNVIFHRQMFLKQLEKWAKKVHYAISQERLDFSYITPLKITVDSSREEIRKELLQSLKKNRQKDSIRQSTSVGPHREDVVFSVDDADVTTFGSQGQQRTTVLSIKLAEIDLIHEILGEYPILLLDDVMSELDNERQKHLLKAIEGKTQTFITTTTLKHLEKLSVQGKIFQVDHGTLRIENKNQSTSSF